ncbi:acyltransferase domain-containing protein [Streptomyces caniferus]|uniref:type I polyketide synthase n=1 Tax=Streptomyces caniferus TaxID=285557 RepID=UPI002E28C23E|nr:polyketide synthase [Streptomyces caniferus]
MSDQDGIAIVGMSCRFPGALDAAAYWSALRNGTDGISRFSADELLAAGAPADQVRRPEYVPARGVLGGGDRFDWAYFGYSRADAARIDPQQRVLLECAANALDDAALDPHRFQGWVGVFGGVDSGTPRLEDDGGDVLARMIGREKDYAATRIAYKLGLRGPAVTVQSACSTSLVAVHMACQSLLSYECDAALAGGAALWLPQTRGYLYREGHVLSRDGRCRPFDADATGMLTSSGVGVVVLKRLADALEQGDRVVAVIRGSAINNDGGEKVGFTTPAFAGQRDVIRMAMAQADADPADIRYVEAHGTGTRVGDPIEVAALAAAFGNAPRPEHCWIGSVKSNLGHTGAASGVAGLIKTALMLQGRELVPTLHYQSPNPELRLAETPFRVCAQRGPLAQDGPLLASVSSFGLGGTNAHAVLEAPAVDTRPPARPVPRLFALSAATPGALERLREDTARRLEDADPPRMDDVARTLAVGRREHPHRLAVRAADADGLAVALRETVPSPTVPAATRTAFLFPGQGTLRPGAGRAAYALLPRFREAFDEVAGLAEARFGTRLTTLLDPDTDPGRVRDTGFQHLGLFTLGYALAEQFAAWGVTPEGMLGHSLGEYVAAACAGVWTLPDALALVQERGRVMQEIAEGRMLAVIADRETADSLLGPALDTGKYWVAIDSTDHTVVSGKPEHIAALHTSLEAQEVTTRLLDFDRGAHSPLMDPGTAALRAAVAATTTRGGAPRIVSNLTGAWARPEDFGDPDYWADHMCGTVRLTDSFGTLLDEGCNVFLELGPGASLSRGVRRHKDWDADGTAVTLLGPSPKEEREALLQALGTLWQRGLPIPLEELAVEPGSMPVSLPPHPLEPSPCTAPSARTTPSGQGPRTTDTPGTGDPLTHERWVQTPAAGAGHHDLVVVAAGPEPGADPGRPPARPRAGTPGDVLTDGFLAALTGADPVGPTVRLGAGELGRVPQAVAEPAATAPLVVVVPDGPADDACTAGLDELADRTEATLLVLAPGAAGFPARGGNGPLTAWADHRARRGGTWPVYVLDPGTGEAPGLPPALSADAHVYAWNHGHWWSRTEAPLPRPQTEPAPSPVVAVVAPGRAGARHAAELAAAGLRVGAFAAGTAGTAETGPAIAGALGDVRWRHAGERLSQRPDLNAHLDDYCAALIARFVLGRAVLEPGTRVAADELRRRLDPDRRHPLVVDFFLRTLRSRGWLHGTDEKFTVDAGAAGLTAAALDRREALGELPGLRLMLEEVAEAFPDVFDGRREPVSVLWPDGEETHLRERLRDNAPAVYDASAALDALADTVRAAGRAAHDDAPLRVLEIGAGHGNFTWRLLEQWPDRGAAEYHVTDVSPLQARRAEVRGAELGLTGLRFGTFDITRDPVEQGLAPGTYDLVVGYNVVHIAPRVRDALRGLGRLLRPGGLLGLVELTRVPLWNDMLNSLAPGWWDFDDDLRQDSIHLDEAAWRQALDETGFTGVRVLPDTEDADHALFLATAAAHSDTARETHPAAHLAAETRRLLPDRTVDAVVLLADGADPRPAADLRADLRDDPSWDGGDIWLVSEDPPAGADWRTAAARGLLDPPESTEPARGHHLRLPRLDAPHLRWLPSLIGRDGVPGVVRVSAAATPPLPTTPATGHLPEGDADVRAAAAEARDAEASGARTPGAHDDGPARLLGELWCEVLGVPRADTTDEFFALGGESLMAVYFLTQIRERLDVRVTMADFMAAPTYGQLLDTVRRALPQQPRPGSGTVEPAVAGPAPAGLITFRATGSRTPAFFVAPAAGSSLCYRELAGLLDDDQPFYGLDSPGLEDGTRPLYRFQDLAAHHIAAIRRVRPHGPYVLGGWSIGAMVAHEMARRFQAMGEQVELLVFVDGLLPHTHGWPVATRPKHLVHNLWYHLQASADAVRGPGRDTGLGKTLALTNGTQAGGRRPGGLQGLGPAFVRVHNAGIRAMLRYRPYPVRCPVVLFKAGMDAPQRARLRDRLAPLYPAGLRVEPAAGDHWTLLSHDHVGRLAEAVDRELAGLREKRR